MPQELTPQVIVQGAVDIVKNPASLPQKLRILSKYSLLGPLLTNQHLGKVAMFHNGRSGSTILGLLLDQHPQIYWAGEIYNLPLIAALENQPPGAVVQVDPRAVLERTARWTGRRYFGFEVKFFHLARMGVTIADYVDLLREFGVDHYINLQRKNALRMLVSKLIGQQHGRMFVKKSERTSLVTIEMPINDLVPNIGEEPQTLLEFLQRQQNHFDELRALLPAEHTLDLSSGEDIFPNPKVAYQRVCEYINIPAVDVDIPTRRSNPYSTQDVIRNFAEVERTLQNTPFEWMLYAED